MFGIGSIFFMRKSNRIGDIKELFEVVYTCKDGLSYFELGYEAPEAPHVDWKWILPFQDNLWSPIVSGLKVLIDLFSFETTGSEIDYFDAWFAPCFHDYILWFDIAMNNFLFL